MIEEKPIYVRTVVPDFALKDFHGGEYGAWYLGHTDPHALDEETLDKLFREAVLGNEVDRSDSECTANFLELIAKRLGYIVFHTWHEGCYVLHVQHNEFIHDDLPESKD